VSVADISYTIIYFSFSCFSNSFIIVCLILLFTACAVITDAISKQILPTVCNPIPAAARIILLCIALCSTILIISFVDDCVINSTGNGCRTGIVGVNTVRRKPFRVRRGNGMNIDEGKVMIGGNFFDDLCHNIHDPGLDIEFGNSFVEALCKEGCCRGA